MAVAEQDRRTGLDLGQQLLEEAHGFEFFQAVRLLEFLAREGSGAAAVRGRHPVGLDASPRDEVVRFRGLPSLAFPAAEIAELKRPAAGGEGPGSVLEMVVSFLGLVGPEGVLPRHYTSLIVQRCHDRNRDYSLRDFFDLFNHRTISLFYRAWEKYRYPFAYERARLDSSGQEELFTFCLRSLVGLATPGLAGRLTVDDETLLYYAGHYAHYPRSAVALETLLADYFELPVLVEQFRGQWLKLPEGEWSRLGSAGVAGSRNNQLGVTAIAGTRVWSVQTKFRLRVGPLTFAQFRGFMPDGPNLRRLYELARLYVGPELEFDVQLELLAAEVPACRLGGSPAAGSRLGWTSWLKSRPFGRNVDDAVFHPDFGPA